MNKVILDTILNEKCKVSHFSIVVAQLQEEIKRKKGWVYIAKNPDNIYFKVGFTLKNPNERAKTLKTAGLLNGFDIVFALDFLDCKRAEKMIHNTLKRFNVSGEFFALSVDKIALEIIKYKEFEKKQSEKYMDYESIMGDINLLETAIYYKYKKK